MNTEIDLSLLGPLAKFAGTWIGTKGRNVGPDKDRNVEDVSFIETITLTPIKSVKNHEQILHGLRYDTKADRNGSPYHEEVGYWLWEPSANEVYRCFTIPRGIVVNAGGKVSPGATSFDLTATFGDPCFGIASIPFLDQQFKTLKYTVNLTLLNDNEFSYREITYMQMPGRKELFEHLDENLMKRKI